MIVLMRVLVSLALIILASAQQASSDPDYEFSVALTSSIELHWKVAGDAVNFKAVMASTGWLSLGFNGEDSDHRNCDMVVGYGAKTGSPGTVSDLFSTRRDVPPADSSQDLTGASYTTDGSTSTLIFSRKLDTGDSKDKVLDPEGTTKLVYAWDSDTSSPRRHGSRSSDRGLVEIVLSKGTSTAGTTGGSTISLSDTGKSLIRALVAIVPSIILVALAFMLSPKTKATLTHPRYIFTPILNLVVTPADVMMVLLWIVMNIIYHVVAEGSTIINRVGNVTELHMLYLFFPAHRNSILIPLLKLPLERSIKYHRWIGYSLAIALAVHCWGSYITWLKTYDGFTADFRAEFNKDYIVFGTIGFAAFILIILTSLTIVRRRLFNKVFYPLHVFLFILFTVMSILHHKKMGIFFAPGVILWIVDRALRFKDSAVSAPLQVAAITAATPEIARVSLRKRPGMKHTAGQYYFLRSKSVLPMQWHPISVASGPSSETLEFLIKGDGPWSKGILGAAADGSMRVEGPYGIAHGWDTHRTLVFVAGGIGVTPFLGMLEDLSVRRKDTAVERVILVWSVRDAAMAATAERSLRMAQGSLGVSNVETRIHVSKGSVELSTITVVPSHPAATGPADARDPDNQRPRLKPKNGEDSTYDSPTATTSTDASPYSNSTYGYADDGGAKRSAPGARTAATSAVTGGAFPALGAIVLRQGRPNVRAIIHEVKSAHGEDIMVLACGPVRMVADAASAAGENGLFFHAETFAF